MKKIQVSILPIDVINGIIHGYNRLGSSLPENSKSLFYVDITERSASDALYSILKRSPDKSLIPVSYSRPQDFRGHTSGAQLAVVLSPNLMHLEARELATHFDAILKALAYTAHTNDTQITIYAEPEIESLLIVLRQESFRNFAATGHRSLTVGDFKLESNITAKDLISIATDPEFESNIKNSVGNTYLLGSEFVFMHYEELAKVTRLIEKYGKACVMHPDLARYYFDNVICKY